MGSDGRPNRRRVEHSHMGEWRYGGLGSVSGRHWGDRLVLGMEHVGRDGDSEPDDGRGQSAKCSAKREE